MRGAHQMFPMHERASIICKQRAVYLIGTLTCATSIAGLSSQTCMCLTCYAWCARMQTRQQSSCMTVSIASFTRPFTVVELNGVLFRRAGGLSEVNGHCPGIILK